MNCVPRHKRCHCRPTQNRVLCKYLCGVQGLFDKVKSLIEEKNYDVNVRDADKRTPLHWAAAKGLNEFSLCSLYRCCFLHVLSSS